MKNILYAVVFIFISTLAIAHEGEGGRVSLESEVQGDLSAGSIRYEFQLFDEQLQTTITDKAMVETHTKLLHIIVYDASKNIFNHEHPEFNGKTWTAYLDLPVAGNYFIWAQGQLQDGTEFSTFTKIQVVGGKPESPVIPLGDHRKGTDKLTVLELDKIKLKAGKMAMIKFKISREDNQSPQISPYLGALAHVIAVSPDGDELIHVHPMEGDSPNTGMIHATFPSEGDYRMWVQLRDRGELKTIPLSVTVSK